MLSMLLSGSHFLSDQIQPESKLQVANFFVEVAHLDDCDPSLTSSPVETFSPLSTFQQQQQQ